jgi:6-phosphofructokinase 1
MATFGIVVGGGPAPGINGVISAATLAARRSGARVVGCVQGFQWLMEGDIDHVIDLDENAVSRIHELGGSILRTSRANPTKDPANLDRVIDSLARLGVDHLISIGGDDTCFSARTVAEAAGDRLKVVHVPKTIDNDLPLPPGIPTFGFETARAAASSVLCTLLEDARTSGRWFFITMMGRNAGHLALGAAHSSGSTLAVVAEEYAGRKIRLEELARRVEGTILKSTAEGRPHGVIVLAEGLGESIDEADLADLPDLPRDEHGHLRLAEFPLGRLVRERVQDALGEHGLKATIVLKDVGYECRCVAPCAYDQEYTRELGAGAVATLLAGTGHVMITRQNGRIVPIPFDELIDPATGKTPIRMLDTTSEAYATALCLQTRLEPTDLEDEAFTESLTKVSKLDVDTLRKRFA